MAERDKIRRAVIWELELFLDVCDNENGVAPCTATSPCWYARFSCQDPPNYARGTNAPLHFCSLGARVSGALPYLKDNFTNVSTKIDPRRWTTERGEIRFKLAGDKPLVFTNPKKTTSQTEDQSKVGQYWQRLLARNPNTIKRKAKLYRKVGTDARELRFQGTIKDIQWNESGVEIRVLDQLWKLGDAKVPNKVSSKNILQQAYNGGANMYVYDVSEFQDATANEPKQVKVEDEIVEYTGKTPATNTLTGCTPGMYGTAAVLHAIGKRVEQILMYADAGYNNGLPMDHVLMDLLGNYAGIDEDSISVEDLGLTAAVAILIGDTTITLNDTTEIPDSGIVKIDDEWIRYRSKNDGANQILQCLRGMYSTSAAAHLINAPVYPTTFTVESNGWNVILVKAKIKSAKTVKKLVSGIQQASMFDVWQDEDSEITARMQRPPTPGTVPDTYRIEPMWLKSRKVDRNEDSRYTRSLIYFDAPDFDPGQNEEDYDQLSVYAGATQESVDFYGDVRPAEIFSRWLYRESDGDWLASHIWSRYKDGTPEVQWAMDIKYDNIKVGNLIYLEIPDLVDVDGDYDVRLYQVVKKQSVGSGKLKFTAVDTGFGELRYHLIGPANAELNGNMTAVQITMDLDLTVTQLVHADWRTGGVHSARILTPAPGQNEAITYTGTTDLGGGITRLTGLTRDADGALGGGVVHNNNDKVLMLHAAASDALREEFGSIGDAANNELDSDGDFVADAPGYYIW